MAVNGDEPNPTPERERLIPRGGVTRWLATALVCMCTVALGVEIAYTFGTGPATATLAETFSLSAESGVPNWYASCLLFACGVALAEIAARAARTGQSHTRRWYALAFVFFYLSVDEAIEIHERLGGWIGTGGVLYFDWVIPAAGVVIVLGIFFWPLLSSLERPLRTRVVASAALYVGGALLMELPLGWWTERAGDENLTYALLDFVEETLELCGASLFLASLWVELRGTAGSDKP